MNPKFRSIQDNKIARIFKIVLANHRALIRYFLTTFLGADKDERQRQGPQKVTQKSTIIVNELYVHIGTYKTGSTALQSFFLENRRFLKKKLFSYPKSGIALGPGHANIAFQILKNEQYYNKNAASLDDLTVELKQGHSEKAIISSENFSQFNDENVETLKEAISFVKNIKIICFVRRQDDLFYSWWQESVRHGSTFDPGDSYPLFRQLFDYNNIIKPWATVFGNKNICIIFFPNQRDSSWSVIPEFFKVLNLSCEVPISNKNKEAKKNKSLDMKTAMLLKYMNNYIASREDYMDLRNNFISTINEFCSINKIKPDHFKLSDEIRTKIEEDFKAKNEIFIKNRFSFFGNKTSLLFKNK